MALFDKMGGFGGLNVGGLASGNFSIGGSFNKLNQGDKLSGQPNSALKELYDNKSDVQTLQYPMDLDSKHYMLFNVQTRVPHEDASANNPITKPRVFQSIALPIPLNLRDDINVSYNNTGLGIFGSAGAGATSFGDYYEDLRATLSTFGADLGSQAVGQIKDMVDRASGGSVSENLAGAAAVGGTLLAAQQLGMVGGLAVGALAAQYGQGFAYSRGVAYNPRMAVLFDNIQFREFNFSYRLIARDAQESDQITQIVRAFQSHMLPAYVPGLSSGTAFFYPHEFQLEFQESLKKHLFEFKPCVLKNVQVSYNNESGPAFFEGTDAPVIVDLSLNFQETKILTRDTLSEEETKKADKLVQEYTAARYGTDAGSEQSRMLAAQDAEFNR